LTFPFDKALINQIKGIEGRRYSKTYRSWYLPYSINSLIALSDKGVAISFAKNDEQDQLFIQYQEQSVPTPIVLGTTDKDRRRLNYLIESFDESVKEEMARYVHYLYKKEYSWNSIKLFSKYALLSKNGKLENHSELKRLDLSANVHEGILEKYLEFCK